MIVLWKPKSSPPRHRSHLLCFFSDKISEMLGLTLVGICIIKSNSSPIHLLSSSSWTWWSASSLITTISSSSSSPICDSCMCHVTAALTSDLRGKHIDHLQTNQWHLIPTPFLVPYWRLLVSSRFFARTQSAVVQPPLPASVGSSHWWLSLISQPATTPTWQDWCVRRFF